MTNSLGKSTMIGKVAEPSHDTSSGVEIKSPFVLKTTIAGKSNTLLNTVETDMAIS